MSKRSIKELVDDTNDSTAPPAKKQRIKAVTIKPPNKETLSYFVKAEWYINNTDDGQENREVIEFSDEDNIKIEKFFQTNKGNAGHGPLSITSNKINYDFYIDKDNAEHGLVCISSIGKSDRIVVDRQEMIQLSNSKDNDIINNFISNIVKLRNKSNISEWMKGIASAGLDVNPIVLFDIHGILQSERMIMDALGESDIATTMSNDIRLMITTFVCNDNKLSVQECESIISSTIGNKCGYNCNWRGVTVYVNWWTKCDLFESVCRLIEEFDDNNHWEKIRDGIDNEKEKWIYKSNEEYENSDELSLKDIQEEMFVSEDNDRSEDINASTFEFIQYTLDNVNACRWLELMDYGMEPIYWVLIGKTRTETPQLAGLIFDYWFNT